MADDNANTTNSGNGNGSSSTTAQAPSQSPGPGEQQRRHRFLPPTSPVEPARPPSHSPLSHGHRAASQPPHPASGFASPPLVPASLSGDGSGNASTRSPSAWSHGQQQMLSSSVRSASFSSSGGGGGGGRGTFGSTFEDDELVDPDDELYDARYGSPYGRGRNPASHTPIDLSRSRSHSLATTGAIVGAGRFDSLSSSASSGVGIGIGGNAGVGVGGGSVGGGGGYNPNANFGRGIGSAANSFVTSNLYGNNAYAGHNNLYPGSRWARRRDDHGRDRENTSPFMRDVGSLVLDDGPGSSFRELWERERAGSSSSGLGLGLGGGGSSYGSSSGGRYAHQYGEYEDDYGIGDDGEEDEYDYGPGGWESGATSRRHSVSGAVSVPPHAHGMQYQQQQHQPVQQLQPRARVSGFNAPEQPATGPMDSPGAGYGRRGGAGGGLLLSDDDLEGALGHLSLNTNTNPAHSQYPAAGAGPLSPLSPTNAGRGRYFDQQQAEHEQGLPRSLSQQRSQGQGHGVGKDWADAYFSPQAGGGPLSPVLGRGGAPTRASYTAHPHAHQPHPAHLPHQQQHLPPHAAHPAQHQHAPPQQQQQQQPQQSHQPQLQGKGIPLHAVPPDWPLYIVEFKAGRTDLFYLPPDSKTGAEPASIRVGDLVIVEADRGKDLGKVINDSITIGEVEAYWAQGRGGTFLLLHLVLFARVLTSAVTSSQAHNPLHLHPHRRPIPRSSSSSSKKEISPKMIYGKAGAGDAQLLVAKMQDELKALALCQTKVRAKKLPMEVVDAEYQWDRRKLTFYFVAEKRIDFRELVRELFRLYKTRIWMAALSGSVGGGGFEA
ncbi:PSP1 C-terminal domain-containing protein [Mycena chlorophos]|uniref:PSP1 C-terminal domain-containing protein n=1 Tax=Mycena chlorophos TaxID=658473 RepID=A0A8H6TP08_MYCCL|nr:PSP1 C-terminal domain-containing protein [Mycena chlorophos]